MSYGLGDNSYCMPMETPEFCPLTEPDLLQSLATNQLMDQGWTPGHSLGGEMYGDIRYKPVYTKPLSVCSHDIQGLGCFEQQDATAAVEPIARVVPAQVQMDHTSTYHQLGETIRGEVMTWQLWMTSEGLDFNTYDKIEYNSRHPLVFTKPDLQRVGEPHMIQYLAVAQYMDDNVELIVADNPEQLEG